ncbi:MAG: hypothetical protein KatS3mg003_2043 [Candidatus Nitrosocaldaceae archaeon]|nr:MAG: hypothetical protein KatS3mg003_2043 [Candidatus Nitrosocaldaceae archaeon]
MYKRVEVHREVYTERTRSLEDRDNYLLKLSAIVPENSYLVSGAMPLELPNIENVLQKIKQIKSKDIKIEEIESIVKQISLIKHNRQKITIPYINNRYFIPGSTIKGAVRSRVEYKLMPKNSVCYSCYRIEEDFDPRYAINHMRFWGEKVTIPRGMCNAMKHDNVCIICDIFGAPALSSLVNFSDAVMQKGDIERLSELNVDAIKPNSRFTLEISCLNMDYIRLGLLFLGLELFSNSPIILGMFKYRFNPKLGKLFRNKYAIGLLKFELEKVIDSNNNEHNPNDFINRAKEELEKSTINEYIEWECGVIKDY